MKNKKKHRVAIGDNAQHVLKIEAAKRSMSIQDYLEYLIKTNSSEKIEELEANRVTYKKFKSNTEPIKGVDNG